jgi:hypothetical protein
MHNSFFAVAQSLQTELLVESQPRFAGTGFAWRGRDVLV